MSICLPSLSANDVYEVAADLCQKPETDFIVVVSRKWWKFSGGVIRAG